MSSFTSGLAIEQVDAHKWRVIREFTYYADYENSQESYTVPIGFVTDGASIPSPLWPILGNPFEEFAESAVLHDYLYRIGKTTRARADYLLYEAMGVQKIHVTKWKRWLIYLGVRLGGWLPWSKYRAK